MSNMAIHAWLERAVSGPGQVTSAVLLLGSHDKVGRLTHWPTHHPPDAALTTAARAMLSGEQKGQAGTQAGAVGLVTRRVRANGKVVGALAMRLADATPEADRSPGRSRPSAGPGPTADPAHPPRTQRPETANDVVAHAPAIDTGKRELLKLIETALAQPRLKQCASALATELALSSSSERVFVGITRGRFVHVAGLSHGSHTGQGQGLARQVGAAMDEAVDQAASICHPQHPDDKPRITLAHAELCASGNGQSVLTVPMFHASQPVGALTFERAANARFDAPTRQRLEAAAAALAPLLDLKVQVERTTWQHLHAGWVRRSADLGRGKRNALAASGALGVALFVAALMSTWTFHVQAPTRLEGQVQRAVVAPIDGFLKTALVRAGDAVKEGQVLAELSDEDLQLERRRWESEVTRHENTYAEAQAKQDRTGLVIANSRMAESRAQLALVDQQLVRTRLAAPFDALVIKGDLTQQLGAPVKRGDLLLTLTPSREFRVMLDIDERDAATVQPGTRGTVTLSALPDRRFSLVIDRVMPVARTDAGRNLFEAEARLEGLAASDTAALRPGLQGLARLDGGERPLAWLLTHRVIDWARLQWWAWLG